MLSQRQALMEAVRANPDDDILRLKYADYIEEFPDSKHDRLQAMFIRKQIENPDKTIHELFGNTLDNHLKTAWGQLPLDRWAMPSERWAYNKDTSCVKQYYTIDISYSYHRGLVRKCNFGPIAWPELFAGVLANNPIEEVNLFDYIPVSVNYYNRLGDRFMWYIFAFDDNSNPINEFQYITIDKSVSVPLISTDDAEFQHLKISRPVHAQPVFMPDDPECDYVWPPRWPPRVMVLSQDSGTWEPTGVEQMRVEPVRVIFETQDDAYAWLSMKLIQYGLKRLGLGKKPSTALPPDSTNS
jgi:uncharacterized protein (TIGR02996 family)